MLREFQQCSESFSSAQRFWAVLREFEQCSVLYTSLFCWHVQYIVQCTYSMSITLLFVTIVNLRLSSTEDFVTVCFCLSDFLFTFSYSLKILVFWFADRYCVIRKSIKNLKKKGKGFCLKLHSFWTQLYWKKKDNFWKKKDFV